VIARLAAFVRDEWKGGKANHRLADLFPQCAFHRLWLCERHARLKGDTGVLAFDCNPKLRVASA